MAAYHDRAGGELPEASLVRHLDHERRGGASDGVGDACRMLRHLGIDLRHLSPAARRMLGDAERLCARCPCSRRCGAFLESGRSQGEPPPFCPNALLFQQLGETLEDAAG
jgi:hypothetical protein